MFTFQRISCIFIVFGMSFAVIPHNKVRFTIFDSHLCEFESSLIDLVQSTEKFFVDKNVSNINNVEIVDLSPYIKQLPGLSSKFRNILKEDEDWSKLFNDTIKNDSRRDTIFRDIHQMYKKMDDLRSYAHLLGDSDYSHLLVQNRHNDLLKIIDYFNKGDSPFKKSPLIGAPPLIALALVVSVFYPISKALIPYAYPNLPCKIQDVLSDYRSRVIDARFDELTVELSSTDQSMLPHEQLTAIKSKPYSPIGYTNSRSLDCEKGCKPIETFTKGECIRDEFNVDEYFTWDYSDSACIESYGYLVRQRVEQIFPVRLLSKLCDPTPQNTTGKKIRLECNLTNE